MREVYIAGACRTAIGSFGGTLRDFKPGDLATIVTVETMKRAGVQPDQVDEVVFGHVIPRTDENNLVARLAALKAGIPNTVPAHVVIRGCGSGMQALVAGTQSIRLGDADVVIAGGVECMSSTPYYTNDMRWGRRLQDSKLIDALWDVLHDPYTGLIMGQTAENIAERFGVTREQQDQYALESQTKANKAIAEGKFKEEIVPVEVKTRKGVKVFDTDEYPIPDTTLEKLASLKPAFKKEGGTVTAGNASGLNDAAAALVLISREKMEELGVKPQARVVEYAAIGCDPEIMGVGPIYAVEKVLKKAGMTLDDIDVMELNEAFASQAYYCIQQIGYPPEKINIYGSGVALGHPVGATGCRIVVTLITALREVKGRYGLATMCIGGGQGMAMIIELID
jgi:acetyl-CoA C-acetyltransferase